MARWYATLEVQLALDSNDEKEKIEQTLGHIEVENKFDRSVTYYVPDAVEVTYLERDDPA